MLINKFITKIINLLRLYSWRLRGLNTKFTNLLLAKELDIMNPQCLTLNHNVKLYKNISIYINSKGSVIIGENSHIAPYGYLLIGNNKLSIGNRVAIGPFCSIFCHSNYYTDTDNFTNSYIDKDITIGNNVFIGAHSVILPGAIIEDNVVIGANSVVTAGIVKANAIYAGNPLSFIKAIN